MRWAKSIAGQLALSTAFATLIGVGIVIAGLAIYYQLAMNALMARVSPSTRAALERLDVGLELNIGHTDDINRVVANATIFKVETVIIVSLCLLGLGVAAGIGMILGRRLAKPIQSVANVAGRIAAGDYGERAFAPTGTIGEPAALVADFNRMAQVLEAAERELAETASAVAHELRTPVTVLRARLQAMLDGVFTPSERELAGLVGQTEMLSAIIDSLRVLSLSTAGRLETLRTGIDLSSEAASVIAVLKPDLESAGLAIETQLDSAPAWADPAQMRQVISAFLDNARRYAASGGQVRIETQRKGRLARLSVLDRGPGLEPDQYVTAFDRFWRAKGSRARHSGGSGLGLAVVRAIAEQHGGRAYATPRTGGGAIFTVEFAASMARR